MTERVTKAEIERWLTDEDMFLEGEMRLCRSWLFIHEALFRHGWHTRICPVYHDPVGALECLCGWDETRKELR